MVQFLVLFALGLLLFWLGWRTRKKVQASMAWPYVPGRVLASTVRQSVSQGDQDHADSVSYAPYVQYEYAVNNQPYHSDRIAFQEKSYSSHKKALETLQAYQPGQPVWVFFDPADPRQAVLDRTAHGNNTALIIGAVLLLASVASLFKR
jgi:hypothetical protein